MTKSGPDDEVSVSVELTENGVTGKAKGRALSLVQRWFGSLLAVRIARNERGAARERLLGSIERKALNQIGAEAVEALRSNPDAVDAVLEAISPPGLRRKQENLGAVVEKGFEDLRLNPPTDRQGGSGAEEITPEIADRLEHYASGASTDEVRERWGRVLAAEIREPGTFSLKVLRIIDELEGDVPATFETLAENRLGEDAIPRCLVEELKYHEQISLVDAGLLHDPGTGHGYQIRKFDDSNLTGGAEFWLHHYDSGAIGIPKTGPFSWPDGGSEEPIVDSSDDRPAIPTYLLTPAGMAIAKILPPVDNGPRYLAVLKAKLPEARLWKRTKDATVWSEYDPIPSSQPNTGEPESDPDEGGPDNT